MESFDFLNLTYLDILKIAIQIFLLYLLKDKILDLIARILHGLNVPLDYLAHRLEKSQSSIIRLNYRQRVLSVFLVTVAFIMIVSEFGTLKEILNATTQTPDPIKFFGLEISVGTFAAASYITIATLLGFVALELVKVRNVLQGIFFSDVESVLISPTASQESYKIDNLRKYLAILFFILLICLASLQGILSIHRYQLSVKLETTKDLSLNLAIPLFYFFLGFLTPVIAAFALLSLDVFISLVAKAVITLLNFIQLLVAVIYMAIEVVIQLTSSPAEKLHEIVFGKKEPKNETLKAIADRLKPLENKNPVYLETLSSMFRLFHPIRKYGNTLMFLSDNHQIHFSVPSVQCEIKADTSFKNIADYIKHNFPKFNGKEVKFKFIDEEGNLHEINNNEKVIGYKKFTDTIIVENLDIPTSNLGNEIRENQTSLEE